MMKKFLKFKNKFCINLLKPINIVNFVSVFTVSCSSSDNSKTYRQDNQKAIGIEEVNKSLKSLLERIQPAAKDESEQEYHAARQGEKDMYPDLSKPELDAQYCLEALNTVDPYILLCSGVVENFRFFDENKQEIIFSASGWEYNKDQGQGSPAVMASLFPSSAGTLSPNGGVVYPFSLHCQPSVELILSIIGYINSHIRCKDENHRNEMYTAINSLGEVQSFTEKTQKISQFCEKIHFPSCPYSELDKKEKYYLTIQHLLENLTYMIIKQEGFNGQGCPNGILPKYTAERMLMAYFFQKFNKDDIEKFYSAIKIVLTNNLIGPTNGRPLTISLLNQRREFLQCVEKKNTPYKAHLQENDKALIVKKDKDGTTTFDSTDFSDCVETAARHTLNLLVYDADSFAKAEYLDDDKELVDTILKAINAGREITVKDRKKILRAFLCYQQQQGGDDYSIAMRSFWNLVVSNMSTHTAETPYIIDYDTEGNEVRADLLNFTKLMYNLAYIYRSKAKDKLYPAKAQIDTWVKDPNNEGKAENAILATLKIFNPGVDISTYFKFEEGHYGTVQVTRKDGLSFEIKHIRDHTYVQFDPYILQKLNYEEFKNYQKDPLSTTLLQKMEMDIPISNDFYSLYSSNEPQENCDSNPTALMFLHMFQNMEQDTNRIGNFIESHPQILESNIKVNGNPFLSFLLRNYSVPYDEIIKAIKKEYQNSSFYDFLNTHHMVTKIDGVEYGYAVDGKSVSLFCIEPNTVKINIPKGEIEIDNKEYKVTRIDIVSPDLKKLQIEGSFEDLEINFALCKDIEVIDLKGLQANKLLLNHKNKNNHTYSSLTTINFPFNCESLIVGKNAFYNCPVLKTLTIPQNVTLCKETFHNCDQLTDLTFYKGVTIGNDAFYKCPALKALKLSEGVTIGIRAFYQCDKLTNLTIPKNVTIGDYALCNCPVLETLKISENVTIGNRVFSERPKLTSLTIPEKLRDSLKRIIHQNCKVTYLR